MSYRALCVYYSIWSYVCTILSTNKPCYIVIRSDFIGSIDVKEQLFAGFLNVVLQTFSFSRFELAQFLPMATCSQASILCLHYP